MDVTKEVEAALAEGGYPAMAERVRSATWHSGGTLDVIWKPEWGWHQTSLDADGWSGVRLAPLSTLGDSGWYKQEALEKVYRLVRERFNDTEG